MRDYYAQGHFGSPYDSLEVAERAPIDQQVVLELYGTLTPEMAMAQSHSRSEPPNWLPGQDSRIRYYAIPPPASPSACRRSFYRANVTCC